MKLRILSLLSFLLLFGGVNVVAADDDSEGDVEYVESKWKVFVGNVYYGMGGASSHGVSGLTSEVGIQQLVGIGYNFNDNHRLSLGLGYQARFQKLKSKYCFGKSESGAVVIAPWGDEEHTRAELTTHTLQFPLFYLAKLPREVQVYGGPVLDLNVHSSFQNHFESGDTDTDITVRKLKQHKVTVDLLAGLKWKLFGVYVRYSPCDVFKKGWGPQIHNTVTAGLTVGL